MKENIPKENAIKMVVRKATNMFTQAPRLFPFELTVSTVIVERIVKGKREAAKGKREAAKEKRVERDPMI